MADERLLVDQLPKLLLLGARDVALLREDADLLVHVLSGVWAHPRFQPPALGP